MLASLFAAVLILTSLPRPAADTCAECRADDAGVALCEPHAEAERLAIAEHGPGVLAEDPERAKAALQALAAQTSRHENVPSADLARALTRGLEHPSYDVSAEVLRLLLEGQDPGVTREVLLEAADGYRNRAREISKLRKQMQKQVDSSKSSDKDDLGAALKRMTEDAELFTRVMLELAGFQDYTEQLLRGLERPEDDCVDALLKVADGVSDAGLYSLPAVTALARSGRRDALERAVNLLDDWQDSLEDLEEREKTERKAKLERKPRSFLGTDEAWEQREQAAKDKRVEQARARVEKHLENGRAMHAALEELVRTRDLGNAPEWNGKPYTVWRSWLQRHRVELPERLDAPLASD